MSTPESIKNVIDDYADTIFAIVGFMNIYRFDDSVRKINEKVLVFQGIRLTPSDAKVKKNEKGEANFVTPDIAIIYTPKNSILGEVKKSLPKEKSLWLSIIEQLMTYDDDLSGWPDSDTKSTHDLTLLLHQSRAADFKTYIQSNSDKVHFTRPFSIVAFNRSDERKPYFFFQKINGSISDDTIDTKLTSGCSIPMEALLSLYSRIKLYDAEPPLAYLLQVIWENVVIPAASSDVKFQTLRKSSKIDVLLDTDATIDQLHDCFSFKLLYTNHYDRLPKIPKREWVIRALDKLVEAGEATWVDATKKSIIVVFKKYDNLLDHFVEISMSDQKDENQLELL